MERDKTRTCSKQLLKFHMETTTLSTFTLLKAKSLKTLTMIQNLWLKLNPSTHQTSNLKPNCWESLRSHQSWSRWTSLSRSTPRKKRRTNWESRLLDKHRRNWKTRRQLWGTNSNSRLPSKSKTLPNSRSTSRPWTWASTPEKKTSTLRCLSFQSGTKTSWKTSSFTQCSRTKSSAEKRTPKSLCKVLFIS